jgi:hypothetical protein
MKITIVCECGPIEEISRPTFLSPQVESILDARMCPTCKHVSATCVDDANTTLFSVERHG